jgi:hypothetical protein
VLNSAAWDILVDEFVQGGHFQDHAKAVDMLLNHTFTNYVNPLVDTKAHPYTLDVYWKSPTALHVHNAQEPFLTNPNALERLKYCNESRSRLVYDVQQSIVKRYNVSILGHYNLTLNGAEWRRRGDALHYDDPFIFFKRHCSLIPAPLS